jgi:hypothetical protein
MLVHRTYFEQVSLENLKKILAGGIISLQEIAEQTRQDQGRDQQGERSQPKRVQGED